MTECLQCCPSNCPCLCHGNSGKSQWISVKEQPPKEEYEKRILAYGIPKCGTHPEKLVIEFCRYYKGLFEFGEYDCPLEATHWMNLPEPPKLAANEKVKD